jgi:hypothetical protein
MKKGQYEPPDTNRPSLGGTEGFDALFEHARRDGFSPAQTDRLWQSIVSAGPGAGDVGPDMPGAPAKGWASGAALKVATVVVIAGGLLAAGFAVRRSASPEPMTPPSVASPRAHEVESSRGDEGPPVVSWEDLPRPRGEPRPAANGAARSRPALPPSSPEPTVQPGATDTPAASGTESEPVPAVAPPVAAPSEGALLLKARQQLASDPSAALALTDEAGKRFPDGPLAPEREVLAIEALARLARLPAARARLSAFRARYPQSPHLAHLESLVNP